MALHIQYLATAVAGWREYLNCMARRLKLLDEETAIYKPYSEFGVTFASKQRIQNLRKKLYDARSILANSLNTLEILRVHEKKVAKICRITASVSESFQCQCQNISSELRNHAQTTQKLLDFSEDVRSMYDDILKLRGQELLHENGLGLARIAQANSTETKVMVSLADQTAEDSRIMRIMTFVAMIYLPANLVLILMV
ncbi:hypothetical protein DL764_005875 [Monosporascus ibericus]|uniref:Fungal N-terminal domain-containing protein n=1 Tax=Monosporascus ibericus TaxID=155417 RepID=A0A4Q4TAW2_9PEZI|nr:hypothetical protein DL764_005875 [Monosporascus ibericus]